MPDVGPVGTLISLAPAAGPIGHLLRTAIDAEQVGATRLHLPAEQPELQAAVTALREQTGLVLTCDISVGGIDVISSGFVDAMVEENDDLPRLVVDIAELVASHPAGIGICGRGTSALPALMAALAAGGHVWVAAPARKDHAALVARASGLARIAGRPPLDRRAAHTLLGVA